MMERGVIRLSQFINHRPRRCGSRSPIRSYTQDGGQRGM